MTRKSSEELLEAVLDGVASAEERDDLSAKMRENRDLWETFIERRSAQISGALRELQIEPGLEVPPEPKSGRVSPIAFPGLIYAAAALLVLGIGIWLFFPGSSRGIQPYSEAPPEVARDRLLVCMGDDIQIRRGGQTFSTVEDIYCLAVGDEIVGPEAQYLVQSLTSGAPANPTYAALTGDPSLVEIHSALDETQIEVQSPVGTTRLSQPVFSWHAKNPDDTFHIAVTSEQNEEILSLSGVRPPLILAELRPGVSLKELHLYQLKLHQGIDYPGSGEWHLITNFATATELVRSPVGLGETFDRTWNALTEADKDGDYARGDVIGLTNLLPEEMRESEAVMRLQLAAASSLGLPATTERLKQGLTSRLDGSGKVGKIGSRMGRSQKLKNIAAESHHQPIRFLHRVTCPVNSQSA